VLKEQCYFFSAIIYAATLVHCGLHPEYSSNHEGITSSHKSGRFKNLMLKGISPAQIDDVVNGFKEARAQQIAKVNLYVLSYSSTITYDIPHR
jgi:hypothetical protein